MRYCHHPVCQILTPVQHAWPHSWTKPKYPKVINYSAAVLAVLGGQYWSVKGMLHLQGNSLPLQGGSFWACHRGRMDPLPSNSRYNHRYTLCRLAILLLSPMWDSDHMYGRMQQISRLPVCQTCKGAGTIFRKLLLATFLPKKNGAKLALVFKSGTV